MYELRGNSIHSSVLTAIWASHFCSINTNH